MNKQTLPTHITNAGEVLIIIGAAGWIAQAGIMKYIFALGAILTTTGRILQHNPKPTTTLRRLYTIQGIGTAMADTAAILMFIHQHINHTTIGNYTITATPAAWLLPFFIFAALEIYTTFRIQAQQNKQTDK